jgi:hypothetical protein
MLAVHGPLSVLMMLVGAFFLSTTITMFSLGDAQTPRDEEIAGQTLIYVTGNEFPVFYMPVMRSLLGTGPVPRRIALLSSMHSPCTISRIDDHTLVIEAEHGLFELPFDRLLRSLETPFEVGERVEVTDFAVTVRSVTEDGRPRAMEFIFHEPLEHHGYRWLYWTVGGLRQFPLPAVGDSVEVDRAPLVEVVTNHLEGRGL